MSYNDDKRELLKLKQGIIEKSDTIKEDKNGYGDKAVYEVVGVKNKISNFFYHYKWHVIVTAFVAAVAAFLIISTVTREKGDIRILAFAQTTETAGSLYYKSMDIELALEQYTGDYDNNGYTHVDLYFMNINKDQDMNYYYTNQTKLFSEIGLGVSQMYIADKASILAILGEQDEEKAFEDLSALYPDDPQVTDKYYYKVKGSKFAEAALYVESCPEDMYIVVRNENFSSYNSGGNDIAEYHRRAMEVMDNIVNDKKINES